ncbi:MAG: hypothetical protein ACOWWM_02550 [Desulfobacterales bacterium]
MKVKDVPQDFGMAGEQKEVCYAVDELGRYVLAPSLGWEPKNVANAQAWQIVEDEVADALRRIRERTASPLAYHMARHQMTIRLLADYVGLFRWQVRRHLTPEGYASMSMKHKRRYADLLEISLAELDRTP